ncbi:MAG: PilW family protein [Stagnimonas sp.]|nr:PilW family protein [Stagnimonas sp.]
MHHTHPRQQQGLTLVELMIALTLGLIVIGVIIGVFLSSSQNSRQNEAIATVQDNARFALDSISRDLAMAGYWGGVRLVDASDNVRISAAARAAVASSTGTCGPTGETPDVWLFNVGTPIQFRNHTVAQLPCLTSANVQDNTDVLMVRRVSGVAAYRNDGINTAVGGTVENRFYVKTNQSIASLFRAVASFDLGGPADCPDSSGINETCRPVNTPVQVYAYTPQMYYVRNWLKTIGDGLPILCRRYLNDTLNPPAMEEDCLAEGVENLQIEWGIGADTVENYTSTPTADQLFQARTARITILVRTTALNVQASNDAKTFTLGDLADFSPTPATGVLRRSFTTTVQLKNFQP